MFRALHCSGDDQNGLAMLGESVYFPLADGRVLEAEITSSVFYDPKGERQNVE